MNRPTLDEIGRKVGTDKSSHGSEPWMWSMDYCRIYDELFTPWRDEPITLLELGYGEWDEKERTHSNPNNGGRSARMWREYFSKADIHVVDITPKNNIPDGVVFHCGSQDDPDFLSAMHDQAGDFDVIIDDASHISSLTIASFEILWPWLRPGGFYVVEDLFSSYHCWFYGMLDAREDPGNEFSGAPTAMQFLKRLADDANYRGIRSHGPWTDEDGENGWDGYPRKYWRGYEIDWIRFSYNLCVIRKRV